MKDGLYGINMLQLLFGVKNAKELSERLESCTDEKYPRVEKLMEEVRVNPELKRQCSRWKGQAFRFVYLGAFIPSRTYSL
ncbi:MAG: hypothetical protein QXY52_03850 [Conexivisphaerales archaeon]